VMPGSRPKDRSTRLPRLVVSSSER
jgi:hypothetical protein